MYIEELIHFAANTAYNFANPRPLLTINDADLKIITSISIQLSMNDEQLTEKQSELALVILNKNRNELRNLISLIDEFLDNPNWKKPFRVLQKYKRISIEDNSILLEFPYEADYIEAIKMRNFNSHELLRGTFVGRDTKHWRFLLTEKNIEWIGSTFIPQRFQASETFLELYNSVVDIVDDIENQLPIIIQENDTFKIINAHKNVPQLTTTDLVETLFLARDYGVTVWDNHIEERIDNEVHPVTKLILSIHPRKHPWVSSIHYSIDCFKDLLIYGGPTLIIVPGNIDNQVEDWVNFALSIGITSKQMSVMFRLPNEYSKFNQYVKTAELNNIVNENTRIVFVSLKISKPLLKSGIKFKTVINLGYYDSMHFTTGTIVDNAQNLVYYSMKEPTKKNSKWQQQEL